MDEKADQTEHIQVVDTQQTGDEHKHATTKDGKKIPQVLLDAQDHAEHVNLGWYTWFVVFMGAFAVATQVITVITAGQILAFIIRDMGHPSLAGWVIQGPLLIQSIFSPIIGRLSDVLDRKYAAGIPPLVSFVGSAVCATSKDMNTLIGGSILIGFCLPTSSIVHAIQAEVLPLKYRALANGTAFLASSIGSYAVAGLGSGAVTAASRDGWRDSFWMQSAFHAACAFFFLVCYWPKRHIDYPKMSVRQYIWTCDPIGCLLFMSGTCLVLLGMDFGGGEHAWDDAIVCAPLTIGLVLLLMFCLYEWKGRSDGLAAHVYFQCGPNFPIAVAAFFVEGWIFYSAVNNIVPQQILHLGFESNSWDISVRNLAYGIPSLVGSMCITWYATKTKDLKYPLILSFVIFLVSTICYANLTPDQDVPQIVYSVICGLGQSGPLTLILPLVQFTAPHSYLATASGLAYCCRAIGGAFGSAVLNAISNQYLNTHYDREVAAAAIDAGLPSSSGPALAAAIFGDLPMDGIEGLTDEALAAAVDKSRWVFARAYGLAWWSILPFVVIVTVALFWIRGVKDMMTEKVQASVEFRHKEKDDEKGVESDQNL
ncbi:major facilitator superfamily domain-containing protein [Lineolata rhizophorae]|uniref:Major facilitator superfamily domain-containing protein n=1 Tax=Lineolata rhizophorae TaxID=578093 RepID=A0A6A6NTU0_9PEZI|nr:major facilitator superfamily domain-containing protein [Lineolata rhizophorae]